MKVTSENLKTLEIGRYAIFTDGVLVTVLSIAEQNIDDGMYVVEFDYMKPEVYAEYWSHANADIFPVSDIKMPTDLTALKESEGSKVKNCAVWFNDLPEGELRRMCLENMDEQFGQERKAHSLVEAIELAVFKEDKDKEYWDRVITNLKALTV